MGTTALSLHVSATSLLAGRGGRHAGGGRLHLVDAAEPRARVRAEPARGAGVAGGRSGGRPASAPERQARWRRSRWPRSGPASIAGAAAGRLAAGRRVLRRRRVAAGGLVSACFAWALRRHPRHAVAGHGWRPVSRLGLRNATLPARAQRAVGGGHRVGDVHADFRGRVSPRRRARDGRPAIGDRRLPGVRRDRCCRSPTIPSASDGRSAEPRRARSSRRRGKPSACSRATMRAA